MPATLTYEVIATNAVTGEQRVAGTVEVPGRRFSRATDAAADGECPSVRINQYGQQVSFTACRLDRKRLAEIDWTMKAARKLVQ